MARRSGWMGAVGLILLVLASGCASRPIRSLFTGEPMADWPVPILTGASVVPVAGGRGDYCYELVATLRNWGTTGPIRVEVEVQPDYSNPLLAALESALSGKIYDADHELQTGQAVPLRVPFCRHSRPKSILITTYFKKAVGVPWEKRNVEVVEVRG